MACMLVSSTLPLTSSGQSSVKVDGGGDGGVHVSGAAEDEVGESWLRLLARLYGRMTSGRSFFFQEVQLQHEHGLKRESHSETVGDGSSACPKEAIRLARPQRVFYLILILLRLD